MPKKFLKHFMQFAIIAIAAIFSMTIFKFYGCSDKQGQPAEDNKISFWHFWSEPNQKKAIESLVRKFEEENDCTVEMTELSWNDGKAKLFAAFNSKTAPDVLELGSDWVAQFSAGGVLSEIKTVDMNKYIDFSTAPCYWQEKVYALPWVVDTRVLFYNTALLDKAGYENHPATYEEMLEMAENINDMPDVNGFGATGNDEHRLYKKIVPLFWEYGGKVFNAKMEPVINSPENVKALDMYLNLASAGYIETQRQLDAAFARGNIGFWVSGGWLINKIENENPGLNYEVSMLPGKDEFPGLSFAGGEYLAISRNTGNEELALKFIQFMTDGVNAIEFCKRITEAGFPADKEYYRDPYYNTMPKRAVFADQLENARMTPIHPDWLEIEKEIENAVSEALYARKTAQEALDEAQEKVLEILKR
ncbi:MAG: extracellular solute-binding protein [Candidatus Kapaibacterium sp.]